MKRFIFLGFFVAFLFASTQARAQSTANDLVGLCLFDGACADYIAANVAGGAVLSNAAFLTGRNQANSANVNLIGIDTGDNTIVNSSASDLLLLRLEDDANRIISFDASADTLIEVFWGDGGTTAAQNLEIKGSTTDADDDQRLCLTGGGACADASRGAYIYLEGEQDGGAGDVAITSVDDVLITGTDDVVIQGQGSGDVITLAGGGTTVDLTVADNLVTVASGTELVLTAGDITMTSGALNIAGAANLGLIAENAGDTACDTTCTAGCVAGYDAGTSAFVACTSALADSCLCAGAAS